MSCMSHETLEVISFYTKSRTLPFLSHLYLGDISVPCVGEKIRMTTYVYKYSVMSIR